MKLEEWQKHILKAGSMTMCGEIEHGFALQGLGHAVNCILSGDRLLPCPECWSAILPAAEADPGSLISDERVMPLAMLSAIGDKEVGL